MNPNIVAQAIAGKRKYREEPRLESDDSSGEYKRAKILVDTNSIKPIRVYYHNTSGMRSKLADIKRELQTHNYDVLCFTESWLYPGIISEDAFDLNQYTVYRRDRANATKESRGGGVLILVHKSLDSEQISLRLKDTEQICVRVKRGLISVCFVLNYVPPTSNLEVYNRYIENIKNVYSTASDGLCVLGDFNLSNVLWEESKDTKALFATYMKTGTEKRLVECLKMLGLAQVNCIRNSKGKILDLVCASDRLSVSVAEDPHSLLKNSPHHKQIQIQISSSQ